MATKAQEITLHTDRVEDRCIEVGRICVIVFGRHYRRLVIIVDMIDKNRVLVDGLNGVLSRVQRISMPIRWLETTKFRLLNLPRDTTKDQLKGLITKTNVVNEWRNSTTGRRHECIKRKERLNDFGRWKLYFVKGQFKKAVQKEVVRLRAEQKKITPKEYVKQKAERLQTHPTLRRVVGTFRSKLATNVFKKQKFRKQRGKRIAKYYRK